MTLRVGVDVGGTFTMAVAVDPTTAEVVARAVVSTTHAHPDGVAAGVIDAVAQVAGATGTDGIELVAHSTTQAVNALLEGDVEVVGVIGLGRAPDLRKARKRTAVGPIEVAEGRMLETRTEFVDVTAGLDPDEIRRVLGRLRAKGAGAICVAEAFAPDDDSNEERVAHLAVEAGLPATTSAALTGLYGLELRTITAALNASILPIAMRTAEFVGRGVRDVGVHSPVMVMRGDGGATDLDGFRRAPARTLYSGPAASVAGALRTGRISDGVVVEVGGTSTNVAAVRGGKPALSYVHVGRHATAIRALDVRVTGVAGGSMLRVRRGKVYGVGPRSAHIAQLAYACFRDPADFNGATAEPIAPRPGDPGDYLCIRLASGERVALTNTCAANALGIVDAGDYAYAPQAAASAAFAVAGTALRLDGTEVARRMIEASTAAVAELVHTVMRQHHVRSEHLVAVGGGAGALGRATARALGLECIVPPGAEVISSIGDALSLVRAERERTFSTITPAAIAAVVDEVEAEVLAAGAAPASVDVHVTQVPDRGAVRAIASGALAVGSGVVPGRNPASAAEVEARARTFGCEDVDAVGAYWVARSDHPKPGRVVVFDRFGDPVLDVRGRAVIGAGGEDLAARVHVLASSVGRHRGPVTQDAVVWCIRRTHLTELPAGDPAVLADVATGAGDEAVAFVAGRE